MSQKGLAPIVIVLIIGLAAGGYFLYQSKAVTISSPSTSVQPTATPTPTPTPSPIIKPTVSSKPLSTTKPSPTPSPSPSASPSTSPSVSSSPTTKPSPVPGVYNIHQFEKDISINSETRGYGISALLKDSNGDYIQDLSDFSFSWSIENTNIADLRVESGDYSQGYNDCFSFPPYNIKSPCPHLRAELGPKSPGSTIVKVKVTKKSENKIVGEATYNLTNK